MLGRFSGNDRRARGLSAIRKIARAYYGTDARIKKLGIADATAIAKYYGLQKKDMTGWNEEDGRWFYVNADGVRATEGFLELDGVRYFIGADGYRVTGWQKLSSGKYYFGSDGVMRTGPVNIDGKLYFFGEKGVMSRSFKKGFDGKYYYPRKNGVLHVGWQTINGENIILQRRPGRPDGLGEARKILLLLYRERPHEKRHGHAGR